MSSSNSRTMSSRYSRRGRSRRKVRPRFALPLDRPGGVEQFYRLDRAKGGRPGTPAIESEYPVRIISRDSPKPLLDALSPIPNPIPDPLTGAILNNLGDGRHDNCPDIVSADRFTIEVKLRTWNKIRDDSGLVKNMIQVDQPTKYMPLFNVFKSSDFDMSGYLKTLSHPGARYYYDRQKSRLLSLRVIEKRLMKLLSEALDSS
jgi:hypothetical protein